MGTSQPVADRDVAKEKRENADREGEHQDVEHVKTP
jgi:hypothetical protein